MVKKIIYLVILIILSLCVFEKVRVTLLDRVVYPVVASIAQSSNSYGMKNFSGQIKAYVRDYAAAEEIFLDVIDNAPTNTHKRAKYRAFYELGNVYYETEQYVEAADAFEVALKSNPGHKKALKKYTRIKMALREYIPAYRQVVAYLKVSPNDAFGHAERCALLTRLGKYAAAREACEKAIEIRESYARAHYDYSVLLQVQGFKDLAEKEYQEAIRYSSYIKSRNEMEKTIRNKTKATPQPF